jgi:hypothetical protein
MISPVGGPTVLGSPTLSRTRPPCAELNHRNGPDTFEEYQGFNCVLLGSLDTGIYDARWSWEISYVLLPGVFAPLSGVGDTGDGDHKLSSRESSIGNSWDRLSLVSLGNYSPDRGSNEKTKRRAPKSCLGNILGNIREPHSCQRGGLYEFSL